MDLPETRYAKTVDGVHIAYQVLGDGPVDIVYLDRGEHELKGVPDRWRLYRVVEA